MTRTDINNFNHPGQPWGWLIGAKIEAVDFDEKDNTSVTNIGLRVKGRDSLVWISYSVNILQTNGRFSFS